MAGDTTPPRWSPCETLDETINTSMTAGRRDTSETAETGETATKTHYSLASYPKLCKSGTDALDHSKACIGKDLQKLHEKYAYTPWLDNAGRRIWGPLRTNLAKILLHQYFEIAMIAVIVVNLVLIIYETDKYAECFPEWRRNLDTCPYVAANMPSLYGCNMTLLVLYTIEVTLRLAVLRLDFFCQKNAVMNIVDLAIVILGWLAELLGGFLNLSWLRIFRIGRLFRSIKFATKVQVLYMLISGFQGSMIAMLYGTLMLVGLLGFFSIFVVQWIHPINVELQYPTCEFCHNGFSSVFMATLTLFQQIIAGDSWGQISVPVIKENWLFGLLLPFIQLIVGVGAMNLILAVVVDRAQEARDNNKERVISEKLREAHNRQRDLLHLFRELDADHSGSLQIDEIRSAFKESHEFQTYLMLSGISEDELCEIFRFCDKQGTGEVSYLRLCRALDEIGSADVKKTAYLTKMYIQMLSDRVQILDRGMIHQRDVLDRIERRLQDLDGWRNSRHTSSVSSSVLPLPRNLPKAQPKRNKLNSKDKIPVDLSDDCSMMTPYAQVNSGSSPNITFTEAPHDNIALLQLDGSLERLCSKDSEEPHSAPRLLPINGTHALNEAYVKEELRALFDSLTDVEVRTEFALSETKKRATSLHKQIQTVQTVYESRKEQTNSSIAGNTQVEETLSQFAVSLTCLQSALLQTRQAVLIDLECNLLDEDALMARSRRFVHSSLQNTGRGGVSGYVSM